MISSLKIDWDWVREKIAKSEHIPRHKNKSNAKTTLRAYLTEGIELAKSKANPRIVTVEKKIANFKPASIEIEGCLNFSSEYLCSSLKGSGLLRIFLVTLGSRLEETASGLMKKDEGLRGYLLDRIGSLTVESLAAGAEERLRKLYASKGLSVSMRFSPGYCDWPIEEQFKLAKALDFSRAGVSLTKSCMMVPRKSISAIVGIGPKELFAHKPSPCALCNMKNCDYQR